jgi:RNAse (barnase) inhibitor barstar
MKIIIDLAGVRDKTTLLTKLEKELGLSNLGFNWDALNDCLRDLAVGGLSKKFEFPLQIEFINWQELASCSGEDWEILKEILAEQEEDKKDGSLKINYQEI